MTDKLDPTEFALTGDDEYDEEHGCVIPPRGQILRYAIDELHLPHYSAWPFSDWLFENWAEFTDSGREVPFTVGDVLSGAVADWCGGRTL